jgi:hypothetical protein
MIGADAMVPLLLEAADREAQRSADPARRAAARARGRRLRRARVAMETTCAVRELLPEQVAAALWLASEQLADDALDALAEGLRAARERTLNVRLWRADDEDVSA